MLKRINFKTNIAKDFIEKQQWVLLLNYLKTEFEIELDENGSPKKFEFKSDVLDDLLNMLNNIPQCVESTEVKKEIITEVLRSLRNCASNESTQNYLITETKITNFHIWLVKLKTSKDLTLKIYLQFLINLVVANRLTSQRIYDAFCNDIFDLLKGNIFIYETSALLYNLSLYKPLTDFKIIEAIFELYPNHTDVEFLHFLLEKLVESEHYWTIHESVKIENRIIALEMVKHNQIKDVNKVIPKNCVDLLVKKFISSSDIIFQTSTSNNNDLEPYESSLILEILATISSNETYLEFLQINSNILINAGMLLINIHRLGKSSENCFTSIQKLSELREPNEVIKEHPAFGFKADLVRLIGNLCWNNKKMQDLAREAEIIPVLLDCCNMDARNPFIMQWVIFATRNLCKKNPENQKIIAEMHQQGTVSSNTLEEMGMTLHSDGDHKIKIVPYDSLKK